MRDRYTYTINHLKIKDRCTHCTHISVYAEFKIDLKMHSTMKSIFEMNVNIARCRVGIIISD